MGSLNQTFKFTYNTTTEEITIRTANVTRTPEQSSVIRQTPTNQRYRQRFGSITYRWNFYFNNRTARAVLTAFQNAYDSGVSVVMAEEQDDGSFTDYDVLINLPAYTPDTLDDTSPIDRGLTIEVLEA